VGASAGLEARLKELIAARVPADGVLTGTPG